MLNVILPKMAANEYLINELYLAYASNFPNLVDFWSHLSKEEIHHQNMILTLMEKEKEKKVFVDNDRFKVEPIDLVKEFLLNKITEAKTNKLTEIDALITAVDLETSLLEHKIFSIFQTDSSDMKTLLTTLQKETEEHLAEVKEELAFMSEKAKQKV